MHPDDTRLRQGQARFLKQLRSAEFVEPGRKSALIGRNNLCALDACADATFREKPRKLVFGKRDEKLHLLAPDQRAQGVDIVRRIGARENVERVDKLRPHRLCIAIRPEDRRVRQRLPKDAGKRDADIAARSG